MRQHHLQRDQQTNLAIQQHHQQQAATMLKFSEQQAAALARAGQEGLQVIIQNSQLQLQQAPPRTSRAPRTGPIAIELRQDSGCREHLPAD